MKTSKLAILSIVAILFLAGSNLMAYGHRHCHHPRPNKMKKMAHMRRVEMSNRRMAQVNGRRSYSSNRRAANDCTNYVNGYYVGGSNYNTYNNSYNNGYNNSYNGRNRVTTTVTTTTTVSRTTTNRSRY